MLAGFTVYVAPERRTAGWFVLGAIGAFIAFPLLARGLMWLAARVGKPEFAALRLALANLHRPGSPTPIVMLSLGLGLTVLVATALIEGNLRAQITRAHPEGRAGLLLRRHPGARRSPTSRRPSPRSPAPASSSRCRRCAAASPRSPASR